MREIEFRGKRLNVNKWEYGFFVQALDIENKPIQNIIIKNWSNVSHIDGRVVQETYKIELNTLGQYTGLKDKNGTKIFEGDIIRMHYFFQNYDPLTLGAFEDEGEMVGVVKCELLDGFYVETLDEHSIGYLQWVQEPSEELEILGNIYDNPELVKE